MSPIVIAQFKKSMGACSLKTLFRLKQVAEIFNNTTELKKSGEKTCLIMDIRFLLMAIH